MIHWLMYAKDILDSSGLSFLWIQNDINIGHVKHVILKDQFIQTWGTRVGANGKCISYKIFKTEIWL